MSGQPTGERQHKPGDDGKAAEGCNGTVLGRRRRWGRVRDRPGPVGEGLASHGKSRAKSPVCDRGVNSARGSHPDPPRPCGRGGRHTVAALFHRVEVFSFHQSRPGCVQSPQSRGHGRVRI